MLYIAAYCTLKENATRFTLYESSGGGRGYCALKEVDDSICRGVNAVFLVKNLLRYMFISIFKIYGLL